jgi:hypothetical protein
MEGNARPRFTPKQRAEVWGERWRNGQCIADIAQALERRNKSGVYRVLALNGGLPQQHAGERRSHWRWRSVRRCRARLPRVDRYAGSRRGRTRTLGNSSGTGEAARIVPPRLIRVPGS